MVGHILLPASFHHPMPYRVSTSVRLTMARLGARADDATGFLGHRPQATGLVISKPSLPDLDLPMSHRRLPSSAFVFTHQRVYNLSQRKIQAIKSVS
ncbi:hypothetical protein H8A97_28070 [Bradyrhizobium sp. Arg62]|uniref:hypothetical protein n=1 Tax=Bradyrhizobium TaxID=374 RepID=UPI001E515B93|nr:MULTISPECIES: hypothetical protein [Bradyrhizobium]MCC8938847.1 hypothetical protein [Bradyrhizobium ivorense]MCC8948860.1 hypothetical protein [Bradyrhizobium brasilense]